MILVILLLIIMIIFFCKKSNFGERQRITVVSFAHNCCNKAMDNLRETSINAGADNFIQLDINTLDAPDDIKEYIRNTKRGAGYWIWKPYAIKQAIQQSSENDIIIYVDASTYFLDNLDEIVKAIKENSILVFKHSRDGGLDQNQLLQKQWTKIDSVRQSGYYTEDWCNTFGNKVQFMAAFVGIINNDVGRLFIQRWRNKLTLERTRYFDDSPGNHQNCSDFQACRWDQQELSLLLYHEYENISRNLPEHNKEKYRWVWHEQINNLDRHS